MPPVPPPGVVRGLRPSAHGAAVARTSASWRPRRYRLETRHEAGEQRQRSRRARTVRPVATSGEVPGLDDDLVALGLQLPGDPLRPGAVGAGAADGEVRRLGHSPPIAHTPLLAAGLPQRAKRQETDPRGRTSHPLWAYSTSCRQLASVDARRKPGRAADAPRPGRPSPHEPPRASPDALLQCPAAQGFVVGAVLGIPRWHARGQGLNPLSSTRQTLGPVGGCCLARRSARGPAQLVCSNMLGDLLSSRRGCWR